MSNVFAALSGLTASDMLGILSGLIMVAVVTIYFRQVRNGKSVPNPASWLIWTVVFIMNTASYFVVVQGNIFKTMTTTCVLLGLIAICSYSLWKGKFVKPDRMDLVVILMVIVIGVFWQTTGDPITANLLLQLILLISFYPIVRGLLLRKLREGPLPWNLAVTSYLFLILAILVDWKSGAWLELVHPIVNGIIGNGSVALIANIQKT